MADVSRLPGPNADFWDWQMDAACRGVDSEMFFHPEGERGGAKEARERVAKALCERHPGVRSEWIADDIDAANMNAIHARREARKLQEQNNA